MQVTNVRIKNQTFLLHPLKAVFWEEMSCLLIADLHLGKAAHFRKQGIPVPMGVTDANWDRLISLLIDFSPARVLFLGDLFHSAYNHICDEFTDLVKQFSHISFELVIGNHDILEKDFYLDNNIIVHDPILEIGPFQLSHFPLNELSTKQYNIAGHVHPCVRLRGNSRQSLRLPCFWFGTKQAVLPAFGLFTGMAVVRPSKEDQVFVIVEDSVVEV